MDTAAQTADTIRQLYLDQHLAHTGRYSLLADAETIATLLRAATAGLKPADCCAAAGLDLDTLHKWERRADADKTSAYGVFIGHLKSARAAGKLEHLENIKKHSVKEWTASAWTLERTDPEQFGKREGDTSSPRVVVQIGVQHGDVQVTVQPTFASETSAVSRDLHSLTGDVASDNSSYVATSLVSGEGKVQPVTSAARQAEALSGGRSGGDPTAAGGG